MADERQIKACLVGTADHAAPTARTMRTNTASLRSVLSVDTRLFSPPTPNEEVARTSTRGWRGERKKNPTMLAGLPTVPMPWREKYVVCL